MTYSMIKKYAYSNYLILNNSYQVFNEVVISFFTILSLPPFLPPLSLIIFF